MENKKAPSLKQAVRNTIDKDATSKNFFVKNKEKNKIIVETFGTASDKKEIRELTDVLSESHLGRFLLKTARDRGYEVGLSDELSSKGVCDPDEKTITIDKNMPKSEKVATLAHELRHAHQFSSGTNLYIEVDSTKTQIQLSRAMEADAESFAGVISYQLSGKGHKDVWDSFLKDGPEVAKAITKQIEKDSLRGKENLHKALFAGFKGWYNDYELREQYDNDHIDVLRQIKKDGLEEDIAFDRTCRVETVVRKICKIGDENYFTDKPTMLNKKEYMGISKKKMEKIQKFFDERKEKLPYLEKDASLEEIPVYEYRIKEGGTKYRKGNGKSVYWTPLEKEKEKRGISVKPKKEKVDKIKKNKQNYMLGGANKEMSSVVRKIYDKFQR
jgi:hypothetical protein